MDNQDELQELDLEAIMREFHDPSKDLPPEEPEMAPEDGEEAAEEAPAEAPKEEPKPTEAAPEKPAPAVEEVKPCVTPAADKGNGVKSLGVPDGRKPVLGAHYKHFKGGDYVLLNVAKDHETCEEIAIYMAINGKPNIWARPLEMFLEDIDDHGVVKPRFELVQ